MTLLVNLMRIEKSWWMLPDDPTSAYGDVSTWRNVVKPFDFSKDTSSLALIWSRFKSFHDTAKKTLADAQLTVEVRRYIKGEDPPPWPGAELRHGCCVWEIVDKSGWQTQTSFTGNLLTGLERSYVSISNDGYTEGINVITGDPTFPEEYYTPGWQGTRPSAPWVVYEEGKYTGIETSKFQYFEATATHVMVGGRSMPGINEAISVAVNTIGDLIAAAVFIPPAGGALDAILRPLYSDVILAFMKWGDLNRARDLGAFHLYETWADGSDKAFTLSAIIALRAKLWETRAHTAHKIQVSDAAPYYIGAEGYGHVWLGDRVATAPLGWPVEHQLFVERVTEIGYEWDEDGPKGWTMTIGYQEPEDPVVKLFKEIQNAASALEALGIG